jgi:hypothetical protein
VEISENSQPELQLLREKKVNLSGAELLQQPSAGEISVILEKFLHCEN